MTSRQIHVIRPPQPGILSRLKPNDRRGLVLLIYVIFLIAGAVFITLLPSGFRGASPVAARRDAEQRTAAFFDSIRDEPSRLIEFLRQMPKGGDLHSHLTGAIYAESYISLAARHNLCWYAQSTSISTCGSPGEQNISAILPDETTNTKRTKAKKLPKIDKAGVYRAIVDALSMRNWQQSGRAAHYQFFDSFGKFGGATDHVEEMLAEVMRRAAGERLSYLELMLTLDAGASKDVAAGLSWERSLGGEQDNAAFDDMRRKLLDRNLPQKAIEARQKLASVESQARALLRCGSSAPCPTNANVEVRFLFQVKRDLTPQQVFAQIMMAYLMVQADQQLSHADRRVVA